MSKTLHFKPAVHLLRAICRLNRLNYPRFAIQTRLPDVPENYGPITDSHNVRYVDYPAGNDHVTKALFWFGGFDPWVVRTMRLLTKPGGTVCDVGANLGDTSLPLASRVGPNGKVFCFEPLPENITRLRANQSANGFSQVVICPFALTSSPCTLEIEIIEGQPGMSGVTNGQTAGKTVQVPGIPFDQWADENGVSTVDVCKIDVQGHELEVLEGMRESIKSKRITSFIIEHEGTVSNDEPVFAFLTRNGYSIYRIENRYFSNAYSLLEEPKRARRTRDFVAVVPGSSSEKLLREA
jgi:FkbM family methyltransferase